VAGFRQDVRYALRLIGRSPGFAAIAIATLAFGIGADMAMFAVVNGVLLKPLRFADPDRLLLHRTADRGRPGVTRELVWSYPEIPHVPRRLARLRTTTQPRNIRPLPPVATVMPAFLSDLRFGVRVLRKTPAFTCVAIGILALGIGANSAMFTLVDALLFRPLAGRADQLVGLYSYDRTQPDSYRAFSYPTYVDVRDRGDMFESLMAHNFSLVGLGSGDSVRQTFVDVVTSNYFETLGVALAAGRTFTAGEERPGARIPVAIVGYDRAALLGRTIKINTIDFTVVGVAPPGFSGTMALLAPDMWLPMGVYDVVVNDIFKSKKTSLDDRANAELVVAGRLKPGITASAAAARLDALSRELESAYPADNKNQVLTVSPLPRMTTSTQPGTDQGVGLGGALLMGLSGIVLLIACLNIANMLLARGSARRKEFAIRLAVGGSRGRIIQQLLTEGILLAVSGAACGLVLAFWGTRTLVRSLESVMPLALQFDPRPDPAVLAVTCLVALAATVLFGVGPACTLSRVDVVSDLKELTADGRAVFGRRLSGRNLLVVGQIALSLMLLAVGGLFARGAINAAAATPGFSYRGQLLVTIDPSLAQYDDAHGRAAQQRALQQIRSTPGVAGAAMVSTIPFGQFHEGRQVEAVAVKPQGVLGRNSPVYRIIGADYFRTLGLSVIRGREFTAVEEESANAPHVVIVDESVARHLFGSEDPLGQMIGFVPQAGQNGPVDTRPMQIVGIAPPVRDDLFDRGATPTVYVPSGPNYRAMMNIHVRIAQPGAEGAALDTIRRGLRQADPALPVTETTTMQAFHDRSIELWAVSAGGRLFVLFGVVALLLAVAGLYGVKSYLVAQRTREIGIRIALGADRGAVMRMILREGATIAAIGIAVGLPLAALLGRALGALLYGVRPMDPLVFSIAPLLLGVAALFATYLPARRATRVSPIAALRT
jgi:predicted permease